MIVIREHIVQAATGILQVLISENKNNVPPKSNEELINESVYMAFRLNYVIDLRLNPNNRKLDEDKLNKEFKDD
jgi:hypothetical protein